MTITSVQTVIQLGEIHVSLNESTKHVGNGEELSGCYCFGYFQYFDFKFTVTGSALEKLEWHEAND